mgnify:CR=1 FL=1
MGGERCRMLKDGKLKDGPVLYWMQRSQRIQDNWSLLYAQEFAKKHNQPLVIIFNLFPEFLDATIRQFDFMLRGLEEVFEDAKKLHIPIYLLYGEANDNIPSFIKQNNISALFTDFNPLKLIQASKKTIAQKLDIPIYEIDSHNIVPAWLASSKQEFAAYTLRPKLNKLLPKFLTDFPAPKKQTISELKLNFKNLKVLEPNDAINHLQVDTKVKPITWLLPGPKAAHKKLRDFIANHLKTYDVDRNDPTLDATSHMSPYLHYGQISAQRIALTIHSILDLPTASKEAYLEELIVRRELAENYCYYWHEYDTPKGFHAWAQKTLTDHLKDKREFIYNKLEFEHAKTHDPLWNAAQNQLVRTGKMHGFMRMYWAKKILEWTDSPAQAQKIAIYLNDKYELDGIDPNGYTGINWSIGGVHDRAWFERDIFGKIRYMNLNGCKRKFDVKKYIAEHS